MCARSANEEDGPTPGWPDDGAARPGRAREGGGRTRPPDRSDATSGDGPGHLVGSRILPRRAAAAPPRQKPDLAPPSTGSITPVRYDAAGESMNAAVRPNSSGVP